MTLIDNTFESTNKVDHMICTHNAQIRQVSIWKVLPGGGNGFYIHNTTPYIHPRLDSRIEPKFYDLGSEYVGDISLFVINPIVSKGFALSPGFVLYM